MMKPDEIAREASLLSEEERASLVAVLLHGLKDPVYEVTDEEVSERVREAEENPSVLITLEELIGDLKYCGNKDT